MDSSTLFTAIPGNTYPAGYTHTLRGSGFLNLPSECFCHYSEQVVDWEWNSFIPLNVSVIDDTTAELQFPRIMSPSGVHVYNVFASPHDLPRQIVDVVFY